MRVGKGWLFSVPTSFFPFPVSFFPGILFSVPTFLFGDPDVFSVPVSNLQVVFGHVHCEESVSDMSDQAPPKIKGCVFFVP